MKSPEIILAVFAHPDDEAFGPAATLRQLALKHTVIPVFASRGEAGQMHEHYHGLSPTSVTETRRAEAHESASILRTETPVIWDFPDGDMTERHVPELSRKIIELARDTGAKTAITFESNGLTGHSDHIMVTRALERAVQQTRTMEDIWYYHWPAKLAEAFGSDYFIPVPKGLAHAEADLVVPHTDLGLDGRNNALDTYRSQQLDVNQIRPLLKGQTDDLFTLYSRGAAA